MLGLLSLVSARLQTRASDLSMGNKDLSIMILSRWSVIPIAIGTRPSGITFPAQNPRHSGASCNDAMIIFYIFLSLSSSLPFPVGADVPSVPKV